LYPTGYVLSLKSSPLRMTTNRDTILFQAIQHDSREALNELFSLYFNSLCRFVHTLTQDAMLSEEIVSDVFFNLWAKRKTLEIRGEIKPYLFKAAKNQAISYLRKPTLTYLTLESGIQAEEPKTADHLIREQESQQHWEALIDTLPSRCRLVFTLHRQEGFTYPEIAQLLDISIKTVEHQMGKALRILREIWSKQYHSKKS